MLFPVDDDGVHFFLRWEEADEEPPIRRIYWLSPTPILPCWEGTVAPETMEEWLRQAPPNDIPGTGRRSAKLVSRFAQVRLRAEPFAALGVHRALIGAVRWRRKH